MRSLAEQEIERRQRSVIQIDLAYNPRQPRDRVGRWTDILGRAIGALGGGKVSKPTTQAAKAASLGKRVNKPKMTGNKGAQGTAPRGEGARGGPQPVTRKKPLGSTTRKPVPGPQPRPETLTKFEKTDGGTPPRAGTGQAHVGAKSGNLSRVTSSMRAELEAERKKRRGR